MLRSNWSELPTRFFGSSRESLFSYTLLAAASGDAQLVQLLPGMITPFSALADGRDGTVMWLPSTPMRKLLVGSPPLPHTPVRSGALQTERSPKPIPSAGVRTTPTPLMRSKTRAQPARSTLFLFPAKLPSKPSVNDGFQATAARPPTFE